MVYLRLRFKDAEHSVMHRFFPQNFPVIVRYGTGADAHEHVANVGVNGALTFRARPVLGQPWRSFTLKFRSAQPQYFVCEARGGAFQPAATLADDAGLDAATAAGQRFFMTPLAWSLQEADWVEGTNKFATAGNGRFTPATGIIEHTQRKVADIGTLAQPVDLVVDPWWKFFRFEFFDRYYGHSDHTLRISIPPVRLEGFRTDPNAAGDPPDTRSNWTFGANTKQLKQCLPWFLRRTAVAALPALTGATMGLRFKTHQVHRTMIYSQDANTRTLMDMDAGNAAHAASLAPGPNRLRYYDLPRLWKSRRYYTRPLPASPPAVGGDFFQNLNAGAISAADSAATPINFSLDDVVLCDGTGGVPAFMPALTVPDRVAVFNHRFNDTLPNSTKHGVFKLLTPPPDPLHTPSTDIPVVENYIYDYPDWTRLVTARGSLFDVFDQRTPDDADPTHAVGARAGVRWKDGTIGIAGAVVQSPPGSPPGTGPWIPSPDAPPGTWMPAAPPAVLVPAAQPFFAIQPFYQQRTSVRYSALFNAGGDEQIGRHDIALLRCCDVDNGVEVGVNLHYLRSFFDFAGLASPPNLTNPGGQAQYALDFSMNVAKRWNGDEPGVNPHRAQLLPQLAASPPASPPAPPPPLKIYVVWFPQSVPRRQAHFRVEIQQIDRDNRGSSRGSGASGPQSFQETPGMQHWFPAAHESGHMDSLPDEYNERWWGASYGQLSFKQNLPGDPFEPDGRDEAGDKPLSPMMNGNRNMRNRYFWHAAEWVRMMIGTPMRVKHGPWDNYFLPSHPWAAFGRTYYPWPIADFMDVGIGRNICDIFLYRLGQERYSSQLMANGPIDGLAVIVLRLVCDTLDDPNLANEIDNRRRILAQMAAATRQFMNNRWYATGTINLGSPPQAVTFNRCALQFTTQFLVTNHPHGSPPRDPDNDVKQSFADDIRATLPEHGQVGVWVGSPAYVMTSPPRLDISIQTFADVGNQFALALPEYWLMRSPPNQLQAKRWKRWIQAVLPGATIRKLP
jgi:hypothetical protein